MTDFVMTRRQAMAALAAAAAVPTLSCGGSRPRAPSASGTEADAEALLADIGDRLLRLRPERRSASTLVRERSCARN